VLSGEIIAQNTNCRTSPHILSYLPVKSFFTLETRKQGLKQRPGIIKVLLRCFTRHGTKVGQRKGTDISLLVRALKKRGKRKNELHATIAYKASNSANRNHAM
jgi:hypothetical protein